MKEMTILPRTLSGRIQIPPSKSYSHRALICAALAGEQARIYNIGSSRDIEATKDVLTGLGREFIEDGEHSGHFQCSTPKAEPLDCGESGSTLRFFIPLALALSNHAEFVGEGRLLERPLGPYEEVFQKCGIAQKKEENRLILNGRLHCGEFHLPGDVSSQFVSGLLMSLPLIKGDSAIVLDSPLESHAYVDMTVEVMRKFGVCVTQEKFGYRIPGNQVYRPTEYTVESDYSQAAFFLVAGALGGEITCEGLPEQSLQGDRVILSILKSIGANLHVAKDGAIKATGGRLSAFRVDLSECPDLAPILGVLAAFCDGESVLYNAKRLRYKESDRLHAIANELNHLGADAAEGDDYIRIRGSQSLPGGSVSAHNDHRIAMAMAMASSRCTGEVRILGSESVKKSMPEFWNRFRELGGMIHECDLGE